MAIIGQTSINLQVSGSDGVMKLTGGTPAATRSLSISGSDDVTIYATGSAVYTMPPSSSTLLGDVTEQYMTNKSGSFVHLEVPVVSGTPTTTPISQSTSIPVIYDTANNILYAYNNGTWQTNTPESASYSTTASYALTSAGLVENATSASYAITASYALSATAEVPAGTVSSSTQVDYTQITNVPVGIVSSSGQVDYTGLTNVPSGIVSSSGQITPLLPSGVVSSSGQVDYTGLTNIPIGIVSSSGQVDYTGITNVPVGIVSSSTQVDYTGITNVPVGIVSSSGQVDYTGLTNIPSGIVSSSGQVVSLVSGQQLEAAGVTGSFTGSFTGSISGDERFKGFSIADPAADDNIALFYTDRAMTITELADVISGTTSVTWNISYAATRDSGAPTDLFAADRTTSTTSGTTTTTFTNASIPAGSWVWYAASALSGTPTQLHITLRYRVT